ncbi:MAG: hypothetical protein ABI199_10955 [Bacteroidia bacterium]
MKTKKLRLIIALCLLTGLLNAQFIAFPFATGVHNFVPNQVAGIGNFPSLGTVRAKLHVDVFRLAPSTTGVNNGELFRTDGESTFPCTWQMFTGATQASLTEKGLIYVPANDSSFVIQATASDLILADNKNKISVAEIIEMQKEILVLKQEIAELKKEK